MMSLLRCTFCGAPLAPVGRCPRCTLERERIADATRRLLVQPDTFILDTETTGLKHAEVIELALIDMAGRVQLNTLIKPKARWVNPHAQRVHGLRLEDLEDAPTWPEVLPELVRLAGSATLLAWNAPFDARMLEQTSGVWGLPHPKLLFVCAMRLYARRYGRRTFGLHKAVEAEGLGHLFATTTSHRALGDVTFVLELLKRLAR